MNSWNFKTFLYTLSAALLLVIISFGFVSIFSKVSAQSSLENFTEAQEYSATNNDVTKESFDYDSFENTANGVTTAVFLGETVINANGEVSWSNGALGSLTKSIAYMYTNPPATTEKYLAYVFDSAKLGIVQPAYAQGIGFSALDPILGTWITFRNIAYVFFVLVMLAIGFMIMFQYRIGGQTVVTAQQAIPNVIVSLLAVTFSFAIAGLLIDLMYLVMALLIVVFNLGGRDFWGGNSALSLNFLDIARVLISNGALDGAQVIRGFVDNLSSVEWAENVLKAFSSVVVMAIVAVAVLVGTFRLFFELLQTYVSIIISIVLAPLILMFGAIPGRKVFQQWISGLIGNLSAFPIVLLCLILYDQITGSLRGDPVLINNSASPSSNGFIPPYLIGQGQGDSIAFMIGLAIILILPDIVKKGKEMMGAKGGVFEQFSGALANSLKTGWTGDAELIPGIGATNLAKSPLTKWFGGVSGRNAGQTTATATGALAGLVGGAAAGGAALANGRGKRTALSRVGQGLRGGSRAGADLSGWQFLAENRKEREKTSWANVPAKWRKLSNKDGK